MVEGYQAGGCLAISAFLAHADAAFDGGFISFDDQYRLVLSRRLKAELPQRSVAENFGAYEGQALRVPGDSALPELAFLSQHRGTIFREA